MAHVDVDVFARVLAIFATQRLVSLRKGLKLLRHGLRLRIDRAPPCPPAGMARMGNLLASRCLSAMDLDAKRPQLRQYVRVAKLAASPQLQPHTGCLLRHCRMFP